jgi:hypothetical protein
MHVEVVADEATPHRAHRLKPTVEEDDMLTYDIATAVWHYGIRNGFGDTVGSSPQGEAHRH